MAQKMTNAELAEFVVDLIEDMGQDLEEREEGVSELTKRLDEENDDFFYSVIIMLAQTLDAYRS